MDERFVCNLARGLTASIASRNAFETFRFRDLPPSGKLSVTVGPQTRQLEAAIRRARVSETSSPSLTNRTQIHLL